MRIRCVFALVVIALAPGCGDQDAPAKADQQPAVAKPDPHPETTNLRAADAVGYDGAALKSKVDRLIDEQQERQKQLEETQKKTEESQQP